MKEEREGVKRFALIRIQGTGDICFGKQKVGRFKPFFLYSGLCLFGPALTIGEAV